MFDTNVLATNILANAIVKYALGDIQTTNLSTFDSRQTHPNDTGQQHQQLKLEFQANSTEYGRGKGRGRGYGINANKPQCNSVVSSVILCTYVFNSLMCIFKEWLHNQQR